MTVLEKLIRQLEEYFNSKSSCGTDPTPTDRNDNTKYIVSIAYQHEFNMRNPFEFFKSDQINLSLYIDAEMHPIWKNDRAFIKIYFYAYDPIDDHDRENGFYIGSRNILFCELYEAFKDIEIYLVREVKTVHLRDDPPPEDSNTQW